MSKYAPSFPEPRDDSLFFYGMAKADTFVQALYRAGKNPTRQSLMNAVTHLTIKNDPWLLTGATLVTSPNSAFPIRYQKLAASRTATSPSSATWSRAPLVAHDPMAVRGPVRTGPLVVEGRVEFELTPEQELVRQTAREFCDREIVPFARDWDRTETMDRAIVGKLADIGFLGAALPAAHGGMGLDTVSYCLVMEELGRADSSVRGIVSVNERAGRQDDREVGDGGAACALAARAVERRDARLLRAHRAGRGVGPVVARDARGARRRRLGADGVEDLHHARHVGRPGARVRTGRRRG